jgi:hypothetical protein
MSKYLALANYLRQSKLDRVTLSFKDIDDLCGLPASAYNHRPWWANEDVGSHVQTQGWRNAGFKVAAVQMGDHVVFERANW